jgi:uncharacterized membrane protein
VAIARLPVPGLLDALRHDGAPPLYYLLLHGWTALFGDGVTAVRSLSAVFAVATLPLFYLLGHRLGGSVRTGVLTLLLAAVNPWVIRYAAEARMYALVMLLATVLALTLHRLREHPTARTAGLLALVGALLLYTHYWSLFLLAAVGLVLVAWLLRGPRRAGLAGIAALAGSGMLFGPWVPSLLFQSRHTGTPWAGRPEVLPATLTTVQDWSTAGAWPITRDTAFALLALLLLAGLAAVRRRPGIRWVAAVVAATLVLAFVACRLQPAAVTTRYTSVVVPLVVLLVAVGIGTLRPVWGNAVVVVLAGVSLVAAATVASVPRSQAAVIAAAVDRGARRGDLVAYCPDQLGPSVSRLIGTSVTQVVYPTGQGPARVDWVDYAKRNAAASPVDFAVDLAAQAPAGSRIWLVRRDGFRTYGRSCQRITETLTALLGDPVTAVVARGSYRERATLLWWAV